MESEILSTLVGAARARVCVELVYRKKLTDRPADPRLVEPYSISTGKQDLLVRCYQLEPEAGWRYFMVHKIQSATASPVPFEPRRPVTIGDAVIEPVYQASPHWSDARAAYRDAVCDALADGVVTKAELQSIQQLAGDLGLVADDVRFVHASLFHRCLGAVLDDGFIDEDDRRETRFLHRVFEELGWAVGQ